MTKLQRWLKLIIFDTLGVLFMIVAILTGWLPGPTGIPLFIIGLSLLSVNHEWAKRYIDLLRKYADRVGDIIFTPRLRWFFDIIAPLFLLIGIFFILKRVELWMLSVGIFCISFALLLFLGNRNRWARLKQKIKRGKA